MNTNFWLKGEIEKKINSTKGPKNNQKNEVQIENKIKN